MRSNLSTEDFELFWLADFKPQVACFQDKQIPYKANKYKHDFKDFK